MKVRLDTRDIKALRKPTGIPVLIKVRGEPLPPNRVHRDRKKDEKRGYAKHRPPREASD